MATSGTIYTGYQNYTRFYLSWQLSTQQTDNNRSLINWQIGIQGTSGYTAYWYSNAVKVNSAEINGGSSLGSGTWSNKTLAGNQKIQLLSGSKWVGHNSDGTKSFSGNVSGWLYSNGTATASGSWALTTIPRNSQVSTNASSYTLGDAITINTNRKSSSFTHTVKVRLNNSGGTVLEQVNSVGASTTWTPDAGDITAMQDAIPNSKTLPIYIESYNNQVSEASDVTVSNIITLADPTFTTFTYKDTSTATVAITGSDQVLVEGKSTLRLQIASGDKMVAIKGATADHYDFQYDGTINPVAYSASTITSDFTPIASTGQRTMTVRAYDSRLNTVSASEVVTVYGYIAPNIVTTLTRENNFGSNTTISISGTYSPLLIGAVKKNNIVTSTMQYRYKETGGAFGSWVTKTFTADTDAGTYTVADFVISLDNTIKYEFELRVDDKFGTVTTTALVDVGTPIMFVGEKSGVGAIGINKMPENGALDVAGDIYSNGEKVIFGATPTITQINNSAAPGVKLQVRVQTDNSNSITNTTQAGVITQYGWGQIVGNGTTELTDTVTFPTAFTTILGFMVTQIGAKGGVASSITDLSSAAGAGSIARVGGITNSSVPVYLNRTSAYAGTAYYGYTWIAWGV